MANAKVRRRRKLIVFLLVVGLVAVMAVVAAFSKRTPPVTIQEDKVIRTNLTELVTANGKIQPVAQVNISPEVSGEIIALPVKEGQFVRKGDLLVKIKPDNYLASSNSSYASYQYSIASKETAMANLEKADLDNQRNLELFKNKLISDSDYLVAKNAYDVAKATLAGAMQQVQVARAALDSSVADLLKTTIYAPRDGTVTRLNSEAGERVVGTSMMAGTEIMTVADLNEMEAQVEIGETDVVLIAPGQQARLEVDAFKDRKFSGTVTEIADSAVGSSSSAAAASSSSSTQEATKFQVKIRVAEKEIFRPGMSVTAYIETRYRTNILAVPIQSVTTRVPKPPPMKGKPGNTNVVQVTSTAPVATSGTNDTKAADAGKPGEPAKPIEVVFLVEGDHVKMVPVKTGICDVNYYEITEGLHEGDRVVSGSYKAISRELEDGKKATVGKHPVEGDNKPK